MEVVFVEPEPSASVNRMIADNTRTDIMALQQALMSMEAKHDLSMAAANEQWKAKFESVEATLMQQSQELTATKREQQESHSPLLQQLTQLVQQQSEQLAAVTEMRANEREQMADMMRDLESRLQTLGAHQQGNPIPFTNEDREGDHTLACNQATGANPELTIERLVQKELQAEAEQLTAQRELQFEIMQQQVETHSRQLERIQESLTTAILDHESLRYEQVKTRQSWYTNFEVLSAQGQQLDGEIKAIAETLKSVQDRPLAEMVKMAETRELMAGTSLTADPLGSPRMLSYRVGSQVSLARTTKSECFEFIQQENDRMMQTWGAQFDDLAIYIQDNLDAQRASIAEARTSTFEHVDAEAQARFAVWNAQHNQLVHQMHQHSTEIQDLKEDQERSIAIVVESLVNLKRNVHTITEQLNEQETLQMTTDIDMQKILHLIERKAKLWDSKFGKYDCKLQSLNDELRQVTKETKDIAEDRQVLKSILEQSIELFNVKTDTTLDRWTAQFAELKRQLQDQVENRNMKLQDHNKLQHELGNAIATWNNKFVDLICLVEHQAIDLEALRNKPHFTESERDPAPADYLESRRNTAAFREIKVDQKKYKKLLWSARQQRVALSEDDPEADLIDFYDLTFTAKSKEQA